MQIVEIVNIATIKLVMSPELSGEMSSVRKLQTLCFAMQNLSKLTMAHHSLSYIHWPLQTFEIEIQDLQGKTPQRNLASLLTPSFRGLATLATLGREAAERRRSVKEVTALLSKHSNCCPHCW